ncbi:hypothetical protein P7K49_012345 [Saguinus oedipus]|uniref:Uncharacterized protein n=1 Tax=Saguinus oedipus TaxID=9490 RepID=A0ABQ9VVK7_SAGOE|nr:hypothetical protein P7K49_012345 [Saguinus oedipus]
MRQRPRTPPRRARLARAAAWGRGTGPERSPAGGGADGRLERIRNVTQDRGLLGGGEGDGAGLRQPRLEPKEIKKPVRRNSKCKRHSHQDSQGDVLCLCESKNSTKRICLNS